MSDFQRDGAPWFSTVIDLDVEWAHDVLGRHMRRASLAARHESACEAVPSGGKRGLELLRKGVEIALPGSVQICGETRRRISEAEFQGRSAFDGSVRKHLANDRVGQ